MERLGAGEQGHALLQTDFFQIGGEAELGFIAQKRLQGALVYPEDIGDRGQTEGGVHVMLANVF